MPIAFTPGEPAGIVHTLAIMYAQEKTEKISLGWKAVIFGVPLLIVVAYLGDISGIF